MRIACDDLALKDEQFYSLYSSLNGVSHLIPDGLPQQVSPLLASSSSPSSSSSNHPPPKTVTGEKKDEQAPSSSSSARNYVSSTTNSSTHSSSSCSQRAAPVATTTTTTTTPSTQHPPSKFPFFRQFPQEMMYTVLSFLPMNSLAHLALVNKRWARGEPLRVCCECVGLCVSLQTSTTYISSPYSYSLLVFCFLFLFS